jgi:hypothetical protein
LPGSRPTAAKTLVNQQRVDRVREIELLVNADGRGESRHAGVQFAQHRPMGDSLRARVCARREQRVFGCVETLDPMHDQKQELQRLFAPLGPAHDGGELRHAR